VVVVMTELSYIGCFGIGIVGTCMQGGRRPGLMVCNQRDIGSSGHLPSYALYATSFVYDRDVDGIL
jgi:hypothetical protein